MCGHVSASMCTCDRNDKMTKTMRLGPRTPPLSFFRHQRALRLMNCITYTGPSVPKNAINRVQVYTLVQVLVQQTHGTSFRPVPVTHWLRKALWVCRDPPSRCEQTRTTVLWGATLDHKAIAHANDSVCIADGT